MRRLFWILCLLCAISARAQFDPTLSHSWALQSYYNPAVAGLDGQLDVKAVYSKQMLGFEGSPSTILATADMPLFFIGPSHGVGLGFMNDQAGLFSTKQIYVQYAYHLKMKKGGKLSFGVRPVLLNEGFDGTKLDVEDASDPAFASNEAKGYGFDIDAGVRYTYKNIWYAGVSAMHCMGPTIKLGDDKQQEMSVKQMFHAMGGYRFKFRTPLYALIAHAQLRTDLRDIRGDLHARLAYEGERHKLYGGLNYSPMYSVGICFGYNFHGINIGYSYEMYTGGIGALNGTHEVVLGYQTDLNLFKKGKNLHKSVRLL